MHARYDFLPYVQGNKSVLRKYNLDTILSDDQVNLETFKLSVMLFPLAFIGIYIGYRILKIIDEKLFYNIIYILILISSTKLIYDFLI